MFLDQAFQHLPLPAALRLIAASVRAPGWQPGRPTILVLNRGRLSLDVRELIKTAPFNFLLLKALRYKAMQARLVPRHERVQTHFYRHYREGDPERREALLQMTRDMLDRIAARFPFQAVLAGNVDYWPDEAMKDVCKERGIPFLVLCRENYLERGQDPAKPTHYEAPGFRYEGAGIAVASESTRAMMLRGGIAGDGQIATTGWPRFDRWLESPPQKEMACITLVSYLPHLYRMQENAREVTAEFIAAARRHRGKARFVIKAKKYTDLFHLVLSFPQVIGSGIRLVASGPMHPLLRQSTAVIGAGSMGIWEALLADAAIVVPWWADAARQNAPLFNPVSSRDAELAYFPRSRGELSQLMDRMAENSLPPLGSRERRVEVFSSCVQFDLLQTAAERFCQFVSQYLSGGPKQAA